jgi:prepilin-type N-terminal cleavage/methylation domain-containing protein
MKKKHLASNNTASSQRQKGFTLVELLVAMAIMTIVLALVVNLLSMLSRSYLVEKVVGETQQDLRRTMERMCFDIRHVGFDPKRSAAAGIEVGTASTLRFTRDTFDATMNDYNGIIDDANQERVTYLVDAANQRLVKILYEGTANQTSQTVLQNIDPANSGFSYLDESGTPTATIDEIRSVIINLALRNIAGWGGNVDRALSAQVKLRNIGLK